MLNRNEIRQATIDQFNIQAVNGIFHDPTYDIDVTINQAIEMLDIMLDRLPEKDTIYAMMDPDIMSKVSMETTKEYLDRGLINMTTYESYKTYMSNLGFVVA